MGRGGGGGCGGIKSWGEVNRRECEVDREWVWGE